MNDILRASPVDRSDHAHMMETAYLLEQLVAMGTTIIVVTHDSELIHACCSRKFCISK